MFGRGIRLRALVTLWVAVTIVGAAFVLAARYDFGVTSSQRIAELSEGMLKFLLFTFGVGVAAMAALETAKRLFSLRGLFHFSQLRRASRDLRLPLLELLAVDRRSYQASSLVTRLDAPLELVCAQIGASLDQAIARFETSRERMQDRLAIESLISGLDGDPKVGPESIPTADKARGDWAAEARSEMERRLDVLQTTVGNRWRWLMRLSSSILAAIVAGLALVVFPFTAIGNVGAVTGAFIFGGFFAGFARDLTSLAERRRQ